MKAISNFDEHHAANVYFVCTVNQKNVISWGFLNFLPNGEFLSKILQPTWKGRYNSSCDDVSTRRWQRKVILLKYLSIMRWIAMRN